MPASKLTCWRLKTYVDTVVSHKKCLSFLLTMMLVFWKDLMSVTDEASFFTVMSFVTTDACLSFSWMRRGKPDARQRRLAVWLKKVNASQATKNKKEEPRIQTTPLFTWETFLPDSSLPDSSLPDNGLWRLREVHSPNSKLLAVAWTTSLTQWGSQRKRKQTAKRPKRKRRLNSYYGEQVSSHSCLWLGIQ